MNLSKDEWKELDKAAMDSARFRMRMNDEGRIQWVYFSRVGWIALISLILGALALVWLFMR